MAQTRAVKKTDSTTIRRSLARSILLTTGIALAISSVASVALEAVRYRQNAEESVTTLGHVIGTYSEPALDFDDPAAGEEALLALSREESILGAAIYSADGALFASYRREGSRFEIPTRPGSDGAHYADNAIDYVVPIGSGDEAIGHVYLRKDLSGLTSAIWQSGATIAGVMAIVLLLASAAASRLREQIARPLDELAASATAMGSGDLSGVVKVDRSDEIGQLAQAFRSTRDGLRALVSQVRESTLAIGDDARILGEEVVGLNEQARVQQATVAETSTSVERVGASARAVRDHVDAVARFS